MLLVVLAASACASAPPTLSGSTLPESTGSRSAASDTRDVGAYIQRGIALLRQHQCAAAIEEGFDPAIAWFARDARKSRQTRIYQRALGMPTNSGAANPILRAMLAAGAAPAGSGDQNIVIAFSGSDWPDTIFLRGYCLVELEQLDAAERSLREALELIEDDFVYACELGHVMHQRREWAAAMALFERAAANADAALHTEDLGPTPAAPEGALVLFNTVGGWKRRAMRGIGFSLFELGRLDDAERAYREVLAIEPNDQQAQNELRLILQTRARGGAAPK